MDHQSLRQLPSVDEVLQIIEKDVQVRIPRKVLVEQVRAAIGHLRQQVLGGKALSPEELSPEQVAWRAVRGAEAFLKPRLRPVINATGVVLHTNLGRAVLSEDARQALWQVTGGYSNLELDLTTGERGSRYSHVVELLCYLTGAEGALVVNNNAAAVLLALNTLAQGKEVIVSRGQLVEIGGSFRVPEVMAASGARLVEVGTTNKTYQRDYRRAITPETALLLKVHPSNYRIRGFTHETSLEELVELGRETGLPVMEDLGSGFLIDLEPYGITGEPTVQEEIARGADVVTFSGDKLLGGPQAGIIVGKKEYIDLMAKNQLTRALRVDKLTMAALEATLKAYLWEPEETIGRVPILSMLTMDETYLRTRAQRVSRRLREVLAGKAEVSLEKGVSQAGGGSLPLLELPTVLITLLPHNGKLSLWARNLRLGEPAVMGRLAEGRLLLDLRTVLEKEEEMLVKALAAAFPD
ncbi:MAG TPA: L-seryl-tRNA(Sec) selenium transferase [Clostridia bacterium]|nr:L-seryl-tRNA(Sec) selenium transferase [Clostridia bacterium]